MVAKYYYCSWFQYQPELSGHNFKMLHVLTMSLSLPTQTSNLGYNAPLIP